MKHQRLASLFAAVLLLAFSTVALAADEPQADTDTRMVSAKVVEVTDMRISIITRAGVEHVIAIDNSDTTVMLEGNLVSLKDLREGDIVTVELDEQNPVKFAKNIDISLQSANSLVARAKP
jgi:ABC-type Fe3+-hydroxamate transport system substrate-binding protein